MLQGHPHALHFKRILDFGEGQGLSTAQIFTFIGYIASTGSRSVPPTIAPTCKGDTAFRVVANSPQWNGWSTSVTNSRFQDAPGLAASDVVLTGVSQELSLQVRDGTEYASRDDVALDLVEPQLDLVQSLTRRNMVRIYNKNGGEDGTAMLLTSRLAGVLANNRACPDERGS